MVFRRSLTTLLAIGVLYLPSAAHAREPGPTWRSETTGSPVSTMQGRWTESDDGRTVELTLIGGHLVEAGTTFEATWLTPFTTKGETPRFESSYEFENHNDLGDVIHLTQGFRFREKGGEWWPWFTNTHKLRAGTNFVGGTSMFGGGRRKQMQFEWRLTGTIEAPTYLKGSASFSIN